MNLKSIKSIGEFELIERIKKWVGLRPDAICGIGDDAAVLKGSGKLCQVLAMDTMVEDVDFRLNEAAPEAIGRKALGINLSDIAAMGAKPKAALVSLVLPEKTPITFVRRFYDGMMKLARKFNVSIVGGDLSQGPRIICSVTLTGEARRGRIVYRTGAKAGDVICVTGALGGSILGKHLNFIPRIREGQFLAGMGVSAMIDISDGFIQDLNHLLERSRLGFALDSKTIPISKEAYRLAKGDRQKALSRAFSDGEDFELLFTVNPLKYNLIARRWRKQFKIPLTAVGQIVKIKGKRAINVEAPGFRHF